MSRFSTRALVAMTLVAFALAGAFAFGPLDPPAGEVGPTGPSLGDLSDAIAGLGGPRSTGFMPFEELEAFLEIPGITGEATDSFSMGWTALGGFVDLGLRAPTQSSRMLSPATVSEEVRLLVANGNASRDMLAKIAAGSSPYDSVTVHLYTTGINPRVYLTLKMDVVEVIGLQYRPESTAAEVTLRANTYTWTQYKQNNQGVNLALAPVGYVRELTAR